MNTTLKRAVSITTLFLGLFVFVPQSTSTAATKIDLGAASGFGVLAYTTVTSTGTAGTVISGTAGSQVGVTPNSSITGFPPAISGGLQANTGQAIAALTAATAASVASLSSSPVAHVFTNNESIVPGSYSLGAVTLPATLNLDGGGNPDAVFIFTNTSSLVTPSSSVINLTGGAQACNVFWQVTSSATLGSSSTFVGHIVATVSITANTGATVDGSLIALTGAVSLDQNTVTNNNCASVVAPPAPVQTSRIDSVTPATCVTSGPTTITLNGSFPAQITNLTVNGVTVASTSWVQSLTSVVITTSAATTSPVLIQVYNGTMPLLALQTFTCTAVPIVVIVPTPTPVPTVPTVVTGTIHVVKIVNNTYGGTATAADFTLWLRNHGTDVVGSPATGVSGVGRTYILAPGTYVLGEVPSETFPNYISNFQIIGGTTPNIVLHAGEDLTVVQTNNELPPLVSPVPVITPPATETGGQLPKTSSPWFNLLMIGIGFMAIGGIVLGLKRSPKI